MKIFNKFKIIAVIVLFTVVFTACGSSEKGIEGKWTTEFETGFNMAFDFKLNNEVDVISYYDSDGNLIEEVFNGNYNINENKIEIELSNGEKTAWDYKINGDKLILSADGDETVLKKWID